MARGTARTGAVVPTGAFGEKRLAVFWVCVVWLVKYNEDKLCLIPSSGLRSPSPRGRREVGLSFFLREKVIFIVEIIHMDSRFIAALPEGYFDSLYREWQQSQIGRAHV